jgi:DNA helicase TIP49 (TBP-interacting protein)
MGFEFYGSEVEKNNILKKNLRRSLCLRIIEVFEGKVVEITKKIVRDSLREYGKEVKYMIIGLKINRGN